MSGVREDLAALLGAVVQSGAEADVLELGFGLQYLGMGLDPAYGLAWAMAGGKDEAEFWSEVEAAVGPLAEWPDSLGAH